MRTNLKLLRVKNNFSQQDVADKTCVTRATFAAVENGLRSGSMEFWEKVQDVFSVPDSDMWELMKNIEEKTD